MSQVIHLRQPTLPYQPIRAALTTFKWLRQRGAEWSARQRARRELLKLDARGLADIGISRSQAAFEAEKPFWRE